MNFFYFNFLNTSQLKNIYNLYAYCDNYDNIVYDKFSMADIDDFDAYILSYDNDVLAGFLLYSQIDGTNEIRGIVHPNYRQRGIFSKMVSMLKSKLKFDDVIYAGKDSYPGIAKCAASLGCTNYFHDFLMEFNSSIFTPSESIDLDVEFDETDNTYYYYLGNSLIGSCGIYEENNTINIYEVFVEASYRRCGYGRQIISDVLWDLVNSGKSIRLHVTEKNTAALKLYISCGFEIVDSIVYYTCNK